jgi:hypothetical protein
MGSVIELNSAKIARDQRNLAWDDEVTTRLGQAGVWPDEIADHVNGLRAKLHPDATALEAADYVLKTLGWFTSKDPFDA